MRLVPVGTTAGDEAATILSAGGLVVVPTDTVYGIAVRGAREGAALILGAAKGRPIDRPIAVLVGSVEQAEEVGEFDRRARDGAAAWWPGPVTLVVPRRAPNDWDLGPPHSTVGLRQPEAPFVTDLALRVGPLAVSSANRHGEPTPETAPAAAASLVGPVDLVIDGGRCAGLPSTVVDLTDGDHVLLREGAVSADQVDRVISGPSR